MKKSCYRRNKRQRGWKDRREGGGRRTGKGAPEETGDRRAGKGREREKRERQGELEGLRKGENGGTGEARGRGELEREEKRGTGELKREGGVRSCSFVGRWVIQSAGEGWDQIA